MQILTLDGSIFSGIDATKVVAALRNDSRTKSRDIVDFMQQVAKRVTILKPSSAAIDIISPDQFLADLEREGFIKAI